MLVDIIVNGCTIPAPPELIEHYYKKEYGLTTKEFMNEPSDRIGWFMKIKEVEGIKKQREQRSQQSQQDKWN